MVDHLLSIVSPHSCYGCGEIGLVLCPSCLNDIKEEPFSSCGLCLQPVANDGQLCVTCRKDGMFDEVWCVGYRSGVLKELIDAYKFESVREGALPLAELLAESVPQLPGVQVVAIPTDMGHVRQLGYDHAELIVREFSKLKGLQGVDLLARTHGGVQHKSGRQARQRQAQDLLTAKRRIKGDVLIVDDVLTTGATMRAAARCLRQAGANRVYGAIIARQPLD